MQPASRTPGPQAPGTGPGAHHNDEQAFDPNIPNVARIYDFFLHGKDNYAADREAARKLLAVIPGAAAAARDNRAFLSRAVRFLAREACIRQFIDLGTGLPTQGSVHETLSANLR